MIKAIIFDYDGVIVNSFPTVFEVYRDICNELKIDCPDSIEKFRSLYGYDVKELRKNLGIKEEDFDKVGEIFRAEIVKKNPNIFDGMKEVLEELSKKYKLFLASANYKEEVTQKAERFGIAKDFTEIFGHEGGGKFFKRESIPHILKKYGFEKDEVIFVGDRDVDCDIAQDLGLKNFILVDYGWGHSEEKVKQAIRVKNPADILNAVEEIINK